jgi:hypothetical protein
MPDESAKPITRGVATDGLVHGKVAQLLNVKQLALNVGRDQGVAEDMEFFVLNRNAGTIRDPDTSKPLGTLRLPKIRVKVTLLADEFSVAEVQGTRHRGGYPLGFPNWLLSGGGDFPLTLKASDHPGVAEIEDKDSIVQVGDPVIQVEDSEASSEKP